MLHQTPLFLPVQTNLSERELIEPHKYHSQ